MATRKPNLDGVTDIDVLYPVSVLAEKWYCTPEFIYGLISEGKLASVQLSDNRAKTRIPAESAREYWKQRLADEAKAARSGAGQRDTQRGAA